MKEEILKLRSEGKTYNQIKEILKCSKSIIAYYCNNTTKEKTLNRTKERRKNLILSKLERFKHRKKERNIKESIRKFKKSGTKNQMKDVKETFKWESILNKFGENTFCYLSGELINLYENDYNFDHIIPTSRGGDNSFENLGILHEKVNQMKFNMMNDEFIEWCIKILKFNGYKVKK